MMQMGLLLKAAVVAAIALLLLVPLGMIHDLVRERANLRSQAVASVRQSFADDQRLAAPFIVWPYAEHWETRNRGPDGKTEQVTHNTAPQELLLFADEATLSATVDVRDDHYRGLHRVRTFESRNTLLARFTPPDRAAIKPAREGGRIVWDTPYLVLMLSDVRGIRDTPSLRLNDAPLPFRQGTRVRPGFAGMHAELPALERGAPADIAIDIAIAGMERFAFVPAAAETKVRIDSSWPHPQFDGRALPRSKEVGPTGFTATWTVNALASDAIGNVRRAVGAGTLAPADDLGAFGVAFVEPVNIYLLAERSVKYGALFIALTFAALFLLDSLRSLGTHPIQYGFVGLALAIFFLLLLALSEHVAFALAYLAAASACVLLVGLYLRHVLAGWRNAAGFTGALAATYGAIYVILIAERTALLMGSLLLFGALAVTMIATRRVDWREVVPSPRLPRRGRTVGAAG
jgi:inner membrane protein